VEDAGSVVVNVDEELKTMDYTVVELVVECEREKTVMMCKNPYIKQPTGITKLHTILSNDAREASTPFPCGQCLPCRINKSRLWQHRICLEAMSYDENAFVTLTYNEENLPEDKSLNPKHVQLFLKRYRKKIHPKKIRFFLVGEYGDKTERPHYHLMIFGDNNNDAIDESWHLGYTYTGSVTPYSASYVAKYTIKALTKKDDRRLDGRHPEYMRCSKQNGGLGIQTISEIAEKLKTKKYGREKIIRELMQERKKFPLGRYLTQKLFEKGGFDPHLKETEYWDYQQEVFDNHLKPGEDFRDNIVNEMATERKAREHNLKVYGKRRPL